MNHAAVKAVSMHSVNRQRANILVSAFWDRTMVMGPKEVSQQERIFEWDGVLRWRDSPPLAKAYIGVPLQALLSSLAPAHAATRSTRDTDMHFRSLLEIFRDERYLLSYDSNHRRAYIVLKEGSTPESSFKAWAHALLFSHRRDKLYATSDAGSQDLELLQSTLMDLTRSWREFHEQLIVAGWDLDVTNLETSSGTRLRLDANSNSDGGTGF